MIVDSLLSATNPNPVKNGVVWNLAADDYVTVIGEAANARFTIVTSPAPANGTVLTIFGQQIKIGPVNTTNEFVWNSTDATVTYNNILAALNRNWTLAYNFSSAIISNPSIGTLTFHITWRELGFQKDFTSVSPTAQFTIDTQTRGVNIEYTEGYQINAQLFQIKSFGNVLLGGVTSSPPLLNEFGQVVSIPLDYQSVIRPLLSNEMVFFAESAIIDDIMWGRFFLKYGAQKTAITGCGVIDLGAGVTDSVFIINSVIQHDDQIGFARYLFDYDADTKAEFLNVRKHGRMLADESANLYFWLSKSMVTHRYKVVYQPFISGVSQSLIEHEYPVPSQPSENSARVLVVPVGFAQTSLSYMNFANGVDSFQIWIEAKSGILGAYKRVSEVRTFYRDDCNCEKVELYFRGDTGCLETIRFDYVEEETFAVSQTEIALPVRINNTFASKMQSGNAQTNTKATEKMTLLSTRKIYSSDIDFFKQFQKSELRFIRAKSETGTIYAAKFIVESAEITTFQKGDDVELRVVGWFAQEILS